MDKKIDVAYKEVYKKAFRDIQNSRAPGFFDEAALPSYTHPNGLMSRLFWDRVETALTIAGDIQNHTVLDFGCGGGPIFLYLQRCHCSISGCDNKFSELSKDMCGRLSTQVAISTDVFELGGRFDTIFALDVLEHIPDLEKVSVKLKELIGDFGQLIISGPTENTFYHLGRRLAGFSGHYHVRNIYDIERQLSEIGLRKTELKTLYWPMPLFRISRWTIQ